MFVAQLCIKSNAINRKFGRTNFQNIYYLNTRSRYVITHFFRLLFALLPPPLPLVIITMWSLKQIAFHFIKDLLLF